MTEVGTIDNYISFGVEVVGGETLNFYLHDDRC